MKFYTFNQNNSGGYFIENDYVREYVIVEANTPEEATERIEEITKDYSQYCTCCGERWDTCVDEEDGDDEPMIYDERIQDVKKSAYCNSCIIYRLNGTKEIVEFK